MRYRCALSSTILPALDADGAAACSAKVYTSIKEYFNDAAPDDESERLSGRLTLREHVHTIEQSR